MIILKESFLNTLPKGTVIGDRASIEEWAKGSVLTKTYFHYSPERDTIMQQGFINGSRSHYDGIYFAYDDEYSKGYGEGSAPIEVMIKVSREKFFASTGLTPEQEKDYDEWAEENPEEAEEFGQPGTIGSMMDWCKLKVWDDGTQIAVMSPSCIGIIADSTNEGVKKYPQTKKNKTKTVYGAAFLNYPTNFTSPDCIPDSDLTPAGAVAESTKKK